MLLSISLRLNHVFSAFKFISFPAGFAFSIHMSRMVSTSLRRTHCFKWIKSEVFSNFAVYLRKQFLLYGFPQFMLMIPEWSESTCYRFGLCFHRGLCWLIYLLCLFLLTFFSFSFLFTPPVLSLTCGRMRTHILLRFIRGNIFVFFFHLHADTRYVGFSPH